MAETILCHPDFILMEPDSETGYSVVRYRNDKSGVNFIATGYFLPTESSLRCELTGDWQKNKKRDGETFVVERYDIKMPLDEEGTIAYLKSLHCGIGQKAAEILYDKYGSHIWDIIEAEPEKIKQTRGCGRVKTDKLISGYNDTMAMRNLLQMFQSSDKNEIRMVISLARKLGNDAVGKIKRNPYIICDYRFTFDQADALAIQIGFDRNRPERISAAVISVLRSAENQGHVYLPIAQLVAYTKKTVKKRASGLDSTDTAIRSTIAYMCDRGELIQDDTAVYRAFRYAEEAQIASDLARLSGATARTSSKLDSYIESYEYLNNIKLDPLQKKAIHAAFDSCVHVITGGPGTGKSTILKGVLYCHSKIAEEQGFDCQPLLMAPTGRAARRMCETTQYQATTIHKALGLRAETEQEGMLVGENLEASIIIVDEASMIDSHIACTLFQAVPSGTQLVIVGDTDQLPAVGCGNVLREIIYSRAISVTRLNTIFRQENGSSIVTNAKNIRDGKLELEWDKQFAFLPAPEPQNVCDAAVSLYCKAVERYGIHDVMLLNPFRNKGDISSQILNARIQEKLNPLKPNALEFRFGSMVFREGDLVMQTKNTDVVSNGDIGTIKRIVSKKNERGKSTLVCMIEFSQTTDSSSIVLTYERSDMENVTLAYCCTIHKSQGAEYSTVFMILHDSQQVMLRRNLIYTGITRAIDRVCIIGTESAIRTAIETDVVDHRNTKLGTRIRQEKGLIKKQIPASRILEEIQTFPCFRIAKAQSAKETKPSLLAKAE